jgi:L-asparaginase II
MQAKIGVHEQDLMCGVHYPFDPATTDGMKNRGEQPTPFRHNCSGKHTGMLAHALLSGQPLENYIDPAHPVQQSILQAFAEMTDVPVGQIQCGVDGCSAPNFAVPLYNAALAFARLADPSGLPAARAAACRRITHAMTAYPFMVAGPDRFDTSLMEVGNGLIVSKAGAEGYQAIALLPGALGPGSPALGLAIKISDGDLTDRARPIVAIEALRQLKALNPEQVSRLAAFGPQTLTNWRKVPVGESRAVISFKLD